MNTPTTTAFPNAGGVHYLLLPKTTKVAPLKVLKIVIRKLKWLLWCPYMSSQQTPMLRTKIRIVMKKSLPVMMPIKAFPQIIHKACSQPPTHFSVTVYICKTLTYICLELHTAIANFFPFGLNNTACRHHFYSTLFGGAKLHAPTLWCSLLASRARTWPRPHICSSIQQMLQRRRHFYACVQSSSTTFAAPFRQSPRRCQDTSSTT